MTTRRCFGLLSVLVLATLAAGPYGTAALAAGEHAHAGGVKLDGKTFAGEMGERGQPKEKAEKDTFIFKDGTFRSTGCDPYGFKETSYAAKAEDGGVGFEAVATSPKEGKMTWKGKVRGDAIEGTAVWEKDGQKTIGYWFKGTAQK